MTLGAGVIGLGVGEQHARAYAEHPRSHLAAICDRDADKLASVGARLPPAKRYARAEDLIDDPDVAVVSVASNDDDHYAQIRRALLAGKHVFAEKPLCMTGDELDDLAAICRAKAAPRLTTNTLLRRSPRFLALKDLVANGSLGRLYSIEADYVYGRLHKLTDGWRGRIPDYSVTLGGAIHVVDLALWIANERPVEVMAYATGLATRGTSFVGNDTTMALLRFESGLIARVGANFASVHPHFHRFVVYGTQATFENRLDPHAAWLWRSRAPEMPPEPVPGAYPGIGKGTMIPAFVDAVCGMGEPEIAESDCFASLAVAIAIDRSIRDGRPTKIVYR